MDEKRQMAIINEKGLIPCELELSIYVGKKDNLTEMLSEEVRKIKEVPSIKPELLKVKIVHDYRATYTIH